MASPELCQHCRERRWAAIVIHPLRYLCWPCYVPFRRAREAAQAQPVSPATPYCETPLVGGFCKRALGHDGDCACA